MEAFAAAREQDSSKQGTYSLSGNNCATFTDDVLAAGGEQLDVSTVMAIRRVIQVLLTGVALLIGCEMKPDVPPRLPGISPTAVWAGWVDGGAWVECWFDPQANANWCTTWSDQTGEVTARTHYVLATDGSGVPDHELKYLSFSGVHIKLQDGRVLEPQRKTDNGLPLIEPPRKRPTE
jgi:hypothetical protein